MDNNSADWCFRFFQSHGYVHLMCTSGLCPPHAYPLHMYLRAAPTPCIPPPCVPQGLRVHSSSHCSSQRLPLVVKPKETVLVLKFRSMPEGRQQDYHVTLDCDKTVKYSHNSVYDRNIVACMGTNCVIKALKSEPAKNLPDIH